MKKRKKYEVRGMMEWHPEFKVGRTRLQVSFTGGHLCGGACSPAVFETSDPVVQAVIEKSAPFRSGKIRVGAVREEADDMKKPDDKGETVPTVAVTEKQFELEYEDIEEVFEFLNHAKGVPLARLSTNESCFEEAKRLGIILKKKE